MCRVNSKNICNSKNSAKVLPTHVGLIPVDAKQDENMPEALPMYVGLIPFGHNTWSPPKCTTYVCGVDSTGAGWEIVAQEYSLRM